MKQSILAGLILLVTTTSADSLLAFEVSTHEAISFEAFGASQIGRGLLETELGVDWTRPIRDRNRRALNVRAWIAEGSVREDDHLSSFELLRFRHHFYDPLHDQPLTRLAPAGLKAYEWALEEPDPIVRQNFSWRDGRRSFLRALTVEDPAIREQELAQTFRILGHVVHLVQDMAVPEHTRNDWHGGVLAPFFPVGTPSLFEGLIDQQRDSYLSLGLFEDYQPRAFDRLRDYWVTGDGKGLSEFTNRSFVSKATNFTGLEEGATGRDPESGRSYPFPRLELARRHLEEITVASPAPGGAPITGVVTFFGSRFFDLATGQSDENRRLTTFGIFDADLVARQADPIFTLNRYNVDAAAGILLRRAVGYSAGLINHFFRTRLDVDALGAEPSDPSIVRIEGINDGPDAMHDGHLLLYADDVNGRRTSAGPLGSHPPIAAGPGEPIVSGLFQVPPDSERFVAVYHGGLGTEEPAPGNLFTPEIPGAVIGKVLGGVRVEEIFKGQERWQIRTPRGLFALPLAADHYQQVKWGDQPDVIIAHTPLLGGASGRIETYDVSRDPDGLTFVVSATTGFIEITPRDTITLPFLQPPLITTINFNQLIDYRQQIAHYIAENRFTWMSHHPFGPNDGTYQLTSRVVRPLTFRTLHEVVQPFVATIPVRLDPEHVLNFGSTEEPYAWQLTEVAADARGRVLGVVAIFPTRPAGGLQVPIFQLDNAGLKKDSGETATVRPYFHLALAAIWAIVDLKDGTVVASTADPVVTVSHQARFEAAPWDNAGATLLRTLFPGLYRENINTFTGGPDPGTRTVVEPAAYSPRSSADGVLDRVEGVEGDLGVSAPGWMGEHLASELEGAGLLDFRTGEVQRVTRAFTYDCPTMACSSEAERAAFIATTSRFDFTAPPVMLFTALRARPAPGGERLVLLGSADRGGPGDTGHLIVWDPEVGRTSVRLSVGPTLHSIAHATSSTVLLWQRPVFGTTPQSGTYLISLDGDRAPVFFGGIDLRSGFRLLDPRYLYRTSDLRFYRLAAPLQPTVLPARLIDVANKPIGDFHVVAVP